jgi:hypothetical protein
MEPHEFLDFLSGKLARRFIDGAQTLEVRVAETDLLPDPDGQFRVNDFFCHDDTWKMVLSRIARESDAVMMDLRGFSSDNAGCIFEIHELINLVPVERVVFIIDRTTDEAFLRRVLEQSWRRMDPDSPNHRPTSGVLKVLRLDRLGTVELQNLLRVLASAVQAAAEGKVVSSAQLSGLKDSP